MLISAARICSATLLVSCSDRRIARAKSGPVTVKNKARPPKLFAAAIPDDALRRPDKSEKMEISLGEFTNCAMGMRE